MGSKLGWLLAAVLVVAIGLIVLFTVVYPSPSDPSAAFKREGMLDLRTVDASPELVVGYTPDGGGNAADDYARAVKIYNEAPDKLADAVRDRFEVARGNAVSPPDVRDMLDRMHAHVATGARKADMRYVFAHTPDEFDVGFYYGPAEDLKRVSLALELLGLNHYAAKEFDKAEAVFKNIFVLGWHMTGDKDRVRVDMVHTGMQIQLPAIDLLKDLYGKWDKAKYAGRIEKIDEYDDELVDIEEWYSNKLSLLWRTRPHAGDVFYVIENDEDRAWRVQALLELGILKFTADTRGDRRYTKKLMEEYASDPDVYLQAAAKAAQEFTERDFNLLGTRGF